MRKRITQLTPAQTDQIVQYQEKWKRIALSTERIDFNTAREAVLIAYAALGKPTPAVIFCDSPQAVARALTQLLKQSMSREMSWLVDSYSPDQRRTHLQQLLGASLNRQLEEQIHWSLKPQIEAQLTSQVQARLAGAAWLQSYEQPLWEQLQADAKLQDYWRDCFRLESWMRDAVWFDLAISVLGCTHDRNKWLAFQRLSEACGWLFAYEKVCLVCDRPTSLWFNDAAQLHAEGLPAIEFIDGFRVYVYQGTRLPEHYGKFHPHQWRSHWLLEETDLALRQILMQGIGYERLWQELETIELDSWQEYTLIGIDADLDEEPLLLLRMVCPSTGLTHVARVPPDMEYADEAIRWVNWDIDPEEFAVQT